ncbi:MAG: CHRD domain-containing protein [Pseudomonadota bacterium]
MLSGILASVRARLLTSSTLPQETVRDGQTLIQSFFQSSVVDDTPAFLIDNDFARLLNFGQITTNNAPAAVAVEGEEAEVFNFRSGRIEANSGPDALATGIQVTGSATIRNFGEIDGDFNGVQFAGAQSSGQLDNFRGGVISSDSRAVDIQGTGVDIRNFGEIVGTGDQRNGTIYTNGTAEDFSISNFSGGTIDAGEDNQGAGISLEIGDEVGDVVSGSIFNGFGATIQGRGQAASNTGLAGDGVRIDDGAEGARFDADIVNAGLITTESDQGTAAGIRIADGVGAQGQILNTQTGIIEGPRNGLYIGEGDHTGLDVLNFGTIRSGSRAVNIDGTGVELVNGGDILGTGDQRNGTIYADGTADDFSVNNIVGGTIDAGEHNQGSGFGVEIGGAADGANTFTLENAGTIQGRGNASAASNLAGDGVRVGNVGNVGVAEATITNTGTITSEGANGTVAGIRFVNGVSFDGTLDNSGTISGVQNGVYFGNPVNGEGADHSDGVVNNLQGGVISSDSRAFNLDGFGLTVNNAGDILGTGDQRNGTFYADGTADDFTVNNLESGTIDAGAGNQGSGFGAEIGGAEDGANTFTLDNAGTIQGRGNASAASNLAGDGVRIGNVGNAGVAEASITNTGTIASEGANGTVAGVRVVNGVDFQGSLVNEAGGLITGVQNGVYFGTGDHTGGSFVNRGTVTSDSRALNIDGEGLQVVNEGDILGTGDQRNGTVYVDGTADGYVFTNTETGVVDAGEGNNGSGLSIQNGNVDGDIVSAAVFNEGVLQGRGDAETGNTIGDGFRLFSNAEGTAFAGVLQNEGLIAGSETSDAAAGIRIDGGVDLLGAIINDGEIRGTVNAIDATEAGSVTFVNDSDGVVDGNVLLGDGDDIVVDLGQINGVIDSGAGDDVLIAGDGDNVLVGGLGDDFLDGGDGIDTVDYSDLDVAVTVKLNANGNGTATRETGFSVSVTDQIVAAPAEFGSQIDDGAEFVDEAVAGNLYYNIHTADFPGGEIRGQLLLQSDVIEGQLRTVELAGGLDASQEPGPTSDSEATGFATVTIVQNLATGEVTYSSELSVTGLNEADLLTPIPGVVSAIHLHNAPAGQNGPVVQDTLVDAGATLDIVEPISGTGVVGTDVIDNVVETDILSSIERVVGSDDADTVDLSQFNGVTIDLDLSTPAPNPAAVGGEGAQDGAIIVDGEIVTEVDDFEHVIGSSGDDLILGNNEFNILDGGAGDDAIHSFGGQDIIIGGSGTDTALFSAGAGVELDLDEDGNGVATVNAPGGATLDQVFDFENINGSNNAGSPNGGNDVLSGNSGVNVLNGQVGDDVLDGEGGDDELIGGLGNDVLIGGEGDDVLTGGEGEDVFVFEDGDGTDTIVDFEVGVDRIQIGDFEPDFSLASQAVQDGADVVISFGSDSAARLSNTNLDQLSEDDFVA